MVAEKLEHFRIADCLPGLRGGDKDCSDFLGVGQ
jgi:hypothetical protein